jgi:Ca2+-binding EF-hand superfamily protein
MRQDQVEALVEDIFSRLDTNQDGVVTIDEFIEACQRVRNHPYITSEKGLVGWV